MMVDDSTGIPRTAVVTGAASGVGNAVASALRQVGTLVIGVDVAEPPPSWPDDPESTWVQGDVSIGDTWDAATARASALDSLGADCFVSCAADVVVDAFLDTPIENWKRLLDINVLGAVRGMQAFIPPMLSQGRGSIAIVCSVNSLFAEDQLSAYSTSKAALLNAARSAALEYAAKGIRINAVCPGAVDTPLLRRHLDSLEDSASILSALERRIPTGQILQPEQVASVVRFLVTSDASGMSGAEVTVDGGLTTTFDFDSSATYEFTSV
ncbi:SDR family oxidoreductase [Actinobacteria bacterium YIM 96077]|uniref:SDR family NAD(P)-dependent oxidoreductase n=1 Tax=Phytoactinopolyspora halophila TaxID=1981511 RepID=A0A329QT05_9ACTN|nr:SDR family oxidoreductase [Phytoactinopolyspora halophila]AYY14950.1 SDR family oxidoreductase [Actinobacteria bacterium YIM 96077]RAW15407.1 SDR family NAD(P)-dependent oxidoreductase [Phytoactinopolyspora halophila]